MQEYDSNIKASQIKKKSQRNFIINIAPLKAILIKICLFVKQTKYSLFVCNGN